MIDGKKPRTKYFHKIVSIIVHEAPKLQTMPTENFLRVRQHLEKIIRLMELPEQNLYDHKVSNKIKWLFELINFRNNERNCILFSELTPREMEVLKRIAEGNSNKEVAEKLYLSVYTVKHYHKVIKSKLEATSTVDLIKYAQAFDLI